VPGSIIFNQDDFKTLKQQKQHRIDANNQFQNLKKISHDYQLGNEILMLEDSAKAATFAA